MSSAAFVLPSDEAAHQNRPFDFLGFLLISLGIASLLYGLDHASRREGRQFLLSGVILVGVFVWYAIRKDTKALIDLRLFTNHVFSRATTTQFLSNGANYAGHMLVPLFLITGCGIAPSGLDARLYGRGIDVRKSNAWILDRKARAPDGVCRRNDCSYFGHTSLSLDDPKSAFAHLGLSMFVRARRRVRFCLPSLNRSGVCFGSQRPACSCDHG